MDIQAIKKEIEFNSHIIATIINESESVRHDDVSDYTKESAAITAYEHICELVFGRGE